MDVYVEPVPRGRAEGEPVVAYAVETRVGKVLKTLETQQAAIHWAKSENFNVLVAHVRDTSKGNPDHWWQA